MISRRRFLGGCCAGIAAMSGARFSRLAFAEAAGPAADAHPILVNVFLRGGMDALSLVAPYTDDNYHLARARLALKKEHLLDLDGYFGLHRAAAPLHALYEKQELAFIMATGLPEVNRSHFKAQELIEVAASGQGAGSRDGWLARLLARQPGDDVFKGVNAGPALAASFAGAPGALALNQVIEFALVAEWNQLDGVRRAVRRMWAPGVPYAGIAQRTLDAADLLEPTLGRDYAPENGAVYPDNDLARNLRSLAQLIRLRQGLRLANVDFGGWDTHENQAGWDQPQEGYYAELLRQLSSALDAFWTDLSDHHDRLTVVVMSEFGRRFKENDNLGTDHGYAGAMLVLTRGVSEKKVFGNWPGLETDQLVERADLKVTTDYRAVLGEVSQKRLLLSDPSTVFGDTASKQLGFLSA